MEGLHLRNEQRKKDPQPPDAKLEAEDKRDSPDFRWDRSRLVLPTPLPLLSSGISETGRTRTSAGGVTGGGRAGSTFSRTAESGIPKPMRSEKRLRGEGQR